MEDAWQIQRSRVGGEQIPGQAIPTFIGGGESFGRNMYFVETASVFADGAIGLWQYYSPTIFDEWVSRRERGIWDPPREGDTIYFDMGMFDVVNPAWKHTLTSIQMKVHTMLKGFDLSEPNMDVYNWNFGTPRFHIQPIKHNEHCAVILGEEVPILVDEGDSLRLERLFIFADGTLRIGTHRSYTNLEAIKQDFKSGRLTTKAPNGARIAIAGLGSVTAVDSHWWVRPRERVREIESLLSQLNGGPDPIETCRAVYKVYEQNPNLETRSLLKTAYAAIPKHLRVNFGDAVTRDDEVRAAISEVWLTEAEESYLAKLPPELIVRIDAAILALAEPEAPDFREIAYIVRCLMRAFRDLPYNIPRAFYAERLIKLVEAGKLVQATYVPGKDLHSMFAGRVLTNSSNPKVAAAIQIATDWRK